MAFKLALHICEVHFRDNTTANLKLTCITCNLQKKVMFVIRSLSLTGTRTGCRQSHVDLHLSQRSKMGSKFLNLDPIFDLTCPCPDILLTDKGLHLAPKRPLDGEPWVPSTLTVPFAYKRGALLKDTDGSIQLLTSS